MKCDCKKCDKGPGHLLVMLSLVAVVLSAVVSLFKVELYLAGTQWMLVAIVLSIYANIFFMTNDCICDKKE
jgi:membrane protein implicated in regulation of membrane protease activity